MSNFDCIAEIHSSKRIYSKGGRVICYLREEIAILAYFLSYGQFENEQNV